MRNVDASFASKGLILISGKSGSGKSTLLNLIAGIIKPSRGHVVYRGKDIRGMDDKALSRYRNKEIGIVFQHYNLFEHQSVLFNIVLPLLIGGGKIIASFERGEMLLDQYGMSSLKASLVSALSGGEKQRVAILRALIAIPSIILADEPTGALDRANAARVMNILSTIAEERLVIVVSHDLELVRRYATRHIAISDGRIISDSLAEKAADEPHGQKRADQLA